MSHMAEAEARRERMCAKWKAGVEVRIIAQEFGVQNPAVWRALRKAGLLPPYSPKVAGGPGKPRAPRAVTASKPPVVVDRDPCFKCGTRGDVGCRHREATHSFEVAPFHQRNATHTGSRGSASLAPFA